MANGGPKRNDYQIEKDDVLISKLYLEGHSYREIARKISEDKTREYTLTHVAIGNDVMRMIKIWQKARNNNIELLVAIELERIAKLEQEYWIAWEKSKKDWNKTSAEVKKNHKGQQSTKDIMTELKEFGDPRYLQGIERCIGKRCELLGLDKEKEIHIKTHLEHTHFRLNEHPLLLAAKAN